MRLASRSATLFCLIVVAAVCVLTPTTSRAQEQPGQTETTGAASAPAAAQPAASGAQQGGAQNTEQFVALTSLPGLEQIAQAGNADGLANFLNQIYRLCIGAAAIIAVIQIMRAGFEFMRGTSSWQANKRAKDLIYNAVFGLLLVLSPVIVFSIINPDILNLNLDFSSLQPTDRSSDDAHGSCNVETTPQQRACFAQTSDILKADYDRCLTTSTPAACANGVLDGFRGKAAACGVNYTQTQVDCLRNQTLTWLPSGGTDSVQRRDSCDVFDTGSFQQVPRNRDNTLSCPAGKEVVSDLCCRVATNSFGCCGARRTEAQQSRIGLAYYETNPRLPAGPACYKSTVIYFADVPTCTSQRESIETGRLSGGTPPVDMRIVRNCVETPQDFAVRVPNDKPICQ